MNLAVEHQRQMDKQLRKCHLNMHPLSFLFLSDHMHPLSNQHNFFTAVSPIASLRHSPADVSVSFMDS